MEWNLLIGAHAIKPTFTPSIYAFSGSAPTYLKFKSSHKYTSFK